MGERLRGKGHLYLPDSSVTALTVCCLFSLLLIGGAADLETSDFARVAKVFYNFALTVCTAGLYYFVTLSGAVTFSLPFPMKIVFVPQIEQYFVLLYC